MATNKGYEVFVPKEKEKVKRPWLYNFSGCAMLALAILLAVSTAALVAGANMPQNPIADLKKALTDHENRPSIMKRLATTGLCDSGFNTLLLDDGTFCATSPRLP